MFFWNLLKRFSEWVFLPCKINRAWSLFAPTGSIEAILTPFERLQTLLQDSAYNKELTSTPHLIKRIYKEYGLKEYYRGLSPVLLRNGPANVVFFIARDEVSSVWFLCSSGEVSTNWFLSTESNEHFNPPFLFSLRVLTLSSNMVVCYLFSKVLSF